MCLEYAFGVLPVRQIQKQLVLLTKGSKFKGGKFFNYKSIRILFTQNLELSRLWDHELLGETTMRSRCERGFFSFKIK